MITKERLGELIEKGVTIYINKYGYIGQCLLNDRMSCDNSILCLDDKDDGEIEFLINLFETKEDAEWHREFDCIERTERLVLPNWEEFNSKYCEVKFYAYKHQYTLFNSAVKIRIINENEVIFEEDFSKENYTLACRKAKELFLGEKK